MEDIWENLLVALDDTIWTNPQKIGRCYRALAQIKFGLGDADPSEAQLDWATLNWIEWETIAAPYETIHIWQDSLPNIFMWRGYKDLTPQGKEAIRVKMRGVGDGPHFNAEIVAEGMDRAKLAEWGYKEKAAPDL